jgi:hypothetical protein
LGVGASSFKCIKFGIEIFEFKILIGTNSVGKIPDGITRASIQIRAAPAHGITLPVAVKVIPSTELPRVTVINVKKLAAFVLAPGGWLSKRVVYGSVPA